MKTVDQRIDEIIAKEGGYVNHPNDRGGATNWGITEQRARAYGYTGDMRNLPRAKAADIYKKMYWLEPKFDYVAKRSSKLADELFDTGVNMGPSVPAKFLQRLLNVLNRGGKAYGDIIADGVIGNMTLHSLDMLIQTRGHANAEKVLLRTVDALQACRYVDIAEKNPTQEDFAWGWLLNRVGVE